MTINSFKEINAKLIDVPSPEVAQSPDGHSGYPDEIAAGDTFDVLKECCGSASREFPQHMWLEGSARLDKARENDKNKTWGINYLDRFTHQGNSHECTCHMVRAEAEACRNRQRGIIFPDGPKKDARYEESSLGSVWLSPLSIYAEANPRQFGGASCRQVLDIACKRGFLPEKTQPRDYGFKHAIQGTAGGTEAMNQSNGAWLPLSRFPAGWEETAALLMPDEVIFTDEPEQALCLLLWGHVLGYGRSGHAIPPAIWNPTSNVVGYVDSYNVVRWDSWSTFSRAVRSGVHCIASMRTPGDWLKPAG